MSKVDLVPLATLVEDFSIYPRHEVDDENIRNLVRALDAGDALPPIVVERKGRRIIDGFHRARAHRRKFGDMADIMVDWVSYPIDNYEQHVLVDAVRRNAQHGKQLSPFDQARCIALFTELSVDPAIQASALHVTPTRIDQLISKKMATGVDGFVKPIKGTIRHLAGQQMTAQQEAGGDRTGGMNQLFYVNQVINLVESGILNEANPKLMDRLWYLAEIINQRRAA